MYSLTNIARTDFTILLHPSDDSPFCLTYYRSVSSHFDHSDDSAGLWEHLTDEELVANYREQAGPSTLQELFHCVYRRYNSRIAFWCFRFTRDRELALDLAHDVFLKAYRRFHTFRSDAKLSTWLFTIARNHCIDAMSKRSSEPETSDIADIRMADPHGLNIEFELANQQYVGRMMEILTARLSGMEAKIMSLHYGHDMPLATVTGMLGLTNPSGAKAYIVSARRKLSRLDFAAVA